MIRPLNLDLVELNQQRQVFIKQMLMPGCDTYAADKKTME